MALLFMDGFDKGDFANKWTVSGSYNGTTTSTRFGTGKAYYQTSASECSIAKRFTASATTVVGLAFRQLSPVNGAYPVWFLVMSGDAGATDHLVLLYATATTIKLYRGATVLGTATFTPGAWAYLEISATIADAGGVVVVRLDGQIVINFTGDTKNGGTNSTLDTLSFQNYSGSSFHITAYDDVYICNSTGTTNNTFLGDVRVQTLEPTGAGSSTQLAPTGGANYANVAETPDSTVTYNSSSSVGDRDTYAMSDLASGTTAVLGVQDNLATWKADAGMGGVKAAVKVGSTVYYDSTLSLGTNAGTWYGAVRETNPATAVAWTPVDVNGIEFGAEVA